MTSLSEFQNYLQSVVDTSPEHTKSEVSDRYIPTLAELSLQVQTLRSSKDNSKEQSREISENFSVLEGLRKYAPDHVLLVGKPGSGKSTSLERLLQEEAKYCLEAIAQGNNKIPPIPILIQLRGLESPVLKAIQEKLSWWPALDLDEKILKALLYNKEFLILLDGLNELPNEKAWKEVEKFRQVCVDLKVSLIITTRELGSGSDLGIAKKLKMLPLTDTQMRDFVDKQLPETGAKLWRQIQGKLRELAETPLLLKMLCDVFEQNEEIPKNRGDLFRKEFAVRYEKFKPERQRNVSDDSRRMAFDLLSHLAFTIVQGEPHSDFCKPSASWITISKTQAETIIANFLAGDRTPTFDSITKSKEWLEDLVEWHLLQIANDPTHIEFHHQLFQEYYAAEWLAKQLAELSDKKLKHEYLNYLKWTEPLAMSMSFVESESLAARLVKLALEVDLYLGARLAGEVKLDWQDKTINLVISECKRRNLPPLIEVICLQKSRSIVNIETLAKALNQTDVDVQATALQALKEIENKETLPYLLEAIQNHAVKNWKSIADITDLLALLDSQKTTIPDLRELLKNQDNGIRAIAILALEKMKAEECIPDLMNAWKDSRIFVRRHIIRALGEIGHQEIIPKLLEILNSCHKDKQDLRKKTKLCHSVGKARRRLPSGSLRIISACKSPDKDKRIIFSAALALAKLNSDRAFSHPDSVVRSAAISLLEKQNIPGAIPRLKEAMKDTEFIVRAEAIRMIGELKIKELLPEVLKALEDSNIEVRMQATGTIPQIYSGEITQKLVEKLKNEDPEIRKTIVDVMRNLNSEQTVPVLFQALKDSDQSVSNYALYALRELYVENAIPRFIEIFLCPTSEDYQSLVQKYLDELAPKEKSDLLEQAKSPDIDIRWKAVKTLARVASKAAVPDLINAFLKANDNAIRLQIINEFRIIANEQVLPQLLDALKDPKETMRRYVAFAIANLGSYSHLNDLWQQQSHNPLDVIDIAIAAIQSRCGFYNYDITQYCFKVESLKEDYYKDTLSIIFNTGWSIAKSSKELRSLGEEALREIFLPAINAKYKGAATGETYNKDGKTDILVQINGENLLIAECKFWGGEKKLRETLDQLLGYATVRDTQLVMLIFNRNKNFTDVKRKITPAIKEHSTFIREVNIDLEKAWYDFLISHPDDRDCKFSLTVMAFDIP